jgi:hypothetical protein
MFTADSLLSCPTHASTGGSTGGHRGTDRAMADHSALVRHNEKILTIRKLLKERSEVRIGGDYAKADTLRDQLVKKYNIRIIDQPKGPSGFVFLDGTSNKLNNTVPVTPVAESNKKRAREEEVATATAPEKKIKQSASKNEIINKPETDSSKNSSTKTEDKPAKAVKATDKTVSKSVDKTPTKGIYCILHFGALENSSFSFVINSCCFSCREKIETICRIGSQCCIDGKSCEYIKLKPFRTRRAD